MNKPLPSAQRAGRPYLKKPRTQQKRSIVTLVERGGEVRPLHVPHVTAETIRGTLKKHADLKSRLHTDESNLYTRVGAGFATHETV